MIKSVKIAVIFFVILAVSCTKLDPIVSSSHQAKTQQMKSDRISSSNRNQDYFDLLKGFLESKKISGTVYEGGKIDTVIDNLIEGSEQLITIAGREFIVCDLAAYKNLNLGEYSNTFYKIMVPKIPDENSTALIYTIHTDLDIDIVNNEFADVLQFKSEGFSGTLVTNALNDRFLQGIRIEEGRMVKSYNLQIEGSSGGRFGSSAASNMNGDCIAYYLVTTTYYSNGHIEEDWQYLYTLCGPCNIAGQPTTYLVPDCDPNSGSGGAPIITTDEINEVETGDDDYSGAAPTIQYNYHATVTRVDGLVSNVIVSPTTVSNPVVWYVDNYGRNTTRTLTLFGHLNRWTNLGSSAWISWSCLVHGRYVYTDGSPVFTRQWANSKQAIR